MNALNIFNGYKTLVAGIGLIALGIYQITDGHGEQGAQSIGLGLAALGLGSKLERTAQASEQTAGVATSPPAPTPPG